MRRETPSRSIKVSRFLRQDLLPAQIFELNWLCCRNDPSREAALVQLWLSALGFPNTEKVFQEECTAAKLLDLDGLQHASKAKVMLPTPAAVNSLQSPASTDGQRPLGIGISLRQGGPKESMLRATA